jgi:hypothetical protein
VVHKLPDRLPALSLDELPEWQELGLGILVPIGRGDSGIDGGAHRSTPRGLILYPSMFAFSSVSIAYSGVSMIEHPGSGFFDSLLRGKYTEDEMKKNPLAVGLAKLAVAKGAPSKGGKARAQKLNSKRRKEIARKAATIRWTREKGKKANP